MINNDLVETGYYGPRSTWKHKSGNITTMLRKSPKVTRKGEAARDRSRPAFSENDKNKRTKYMEESLAWSVGGTAAAAHKHNNYAEKSKESEAKLGFRLRVSESALKGFVTKKTLGKDVAVPREEVEGVAVHAAEEEAEEEAEGGAEGGAEEEAESETEGGTECGTEANDGEEGAEVEAVVDAMDVVHGGSA
jgi:hypothetical protein